MKIQFDVHDRDELLDRIQNAVLEPAVRKIVDFDLKGSELVVTISKLGKSRLIFAISENQTGLVADLVKEKIALAHKPFYHEVNSDVRDVIQQAGGVIDG